ncbi:MAG: DoxX family protein [Gemmatimonadota bacterium]
MAERSTTGFEGISLNVLRILAGLLFMQHGAQKLFGWLGGMGGGGESAALMSQMGLAGIIEFFGGLLIALGLFTVPVALVALAEMIVAYFQAHIGQGFWPILNGGEPALLFGAIWLYIAARGPGDFSLDAKLRGGEAATEPASASAFQPAGGGEPRESSSPGSGPMGGPPAG